MTATLVIVMPGWLGAALDVALLVVLVLVGREYRQCRRAVESVQRAINERAARKESVR